MIPKTEAEALAQLRKIQDSLSSMKKGMVDIEHNYQYPPEDRSIAESIRKFCDANEQEVTDVIAGLSQIFAQKNPSSVSAIIAELTKK